MSRAAWPAIAVVLGACGRPAPKSPEPADPEPTDSDEPDPPGKNATPAPAPTEDAAIRQVSAYTAPTQQGTYDDPKIAALIAQIDPHGYERWPLTPNKHPVLEPAYEIARVFADPTVSWLDLCRMGAQNRRGAGNTDQLEYLRAWCDVAKRDAAAAVTRLRPLINSSVLGMPAAVRSDIANIVVDGGGADFAQEVLTRAQVDDVAIFDLVGAGYVEVGKIPDAIELTDRSIAAHDQRHPADHCMRIARKIVLVDPSARTPLIVSLDKLPKCEALYQELMCWHKQHCDPYLIAHGIKPDQLRLGEIYKAWPKPGASTDDWLKSARDARVSYAAGYEEAVIRAVEGGLRSIGCTGPRVSEFTNIAASLAARSARIDDQPELRERLRALAALPEVACTLD